MAVGRDDVVLRLSGLLVGLSLSTRNATHHLDDILCPSPYLVHLAIARTHPTRCIRSEANGVALLITTSIAIAHHNIESNLLTLGKA